MSKGTGTMTLKRQVTIKTLVNDTFRSKASDELSNEIKMIDIQLEQLDSQYQQTLRQLEQMAQQGQNVKVPLEQLNRDAQGKRNQLTSLKLEVSNQIANLGNVSNGSYVVTGVLESFVDIKPGDNIYEKVQGAEILIEDGVVREVNG